MSLSTNKIYAQSSEYKEYAFNREGNDCYFNYICYAPNNDYTSSKRPLIFILGKVGQSTLESFQEDTLKKFPSFYNYKFIYVPNRGGNSNYKLYCLDALVNLITWNYQYGRENVFLFINDETINDSAVDAVRLRSVFKSVVLNDVQIDKKVTNDFKENTADYVSGNEKEEDKLGTFYYEEEEKGKEAPPSNPLSTKTYFGPARSFNYALSGIVKDKSTGEALPFATVLIQSARTSVATNVDGYFTLSKVPSDTSVIIVSYLGYSTTPINLTPSLPKSNFVIELTPIENSLKSFVLKANQENVVLTKKEDVSIIKITPKQLEKLPSIGEKDVMRAFQLMPGVSASQESSSGLYVRGGTPDQNLVLFDGFTVYHVDHLYGFFSAFNANAVKDIQLYKGGFESRFGGRLSSVTEITGKDGSQKKFNMGADISLLSVNAWAEIPIGDKFSSIIAVRRSYKGPIYNKLFEKYSKSSTSSNTTQQVGPGGNRFRQNAKATSYFYDLNGKFTYRPNKKDILTLSIFNGTDKLDNSLDNSNLPSFGGNTNNSFSSIDLTKYGNIGSSLKWSRKWSSRFYSNTILSYSNYYSDRDRSTERTVTNSSGDETTTKSGLLENNNLKDYSLKSDYQWDIKSYSQLQFGVFGTYYDIHYTYSQNDTNTILDKKNVSLLTGAYLQNKFKLFKDRLIMIAGIRASYFGTTKQLYYEPRASLTWNITDNLVLKGATGRYFQFANVITREDILSGSKQFWLLSDWKNIPVSSSDHYIAGLSYKTKNYFFSAEGYYKQVKNITEYSLRFNPSPMGVKYDENFFTGNSYARGIEFLLQKKTGKLNGWVSYTLGEAKNYFKVYSDSYFPANQDVTHEFKIVLQYSWKRWDFSATWVYATGRPYTAPSGAYSVTLLDGSTKDFYTVTTKNGLRLPNYHRADVSANYKLLAGYSGDKKRREIGYIGFSIFNLYNRTNVWYKTYSLESGSILETNVNYTSITPNVTLSLKIR
ncbi:MAG: TonB-dependent receptor [Bacteroidetes bacterium]|nr:TonB-dependent receptor [Bacteroidota bacterium]